MNKKISSIIFLIVCSVLCGCNSSNSGATEPTKQTIPEAKVAEEAADVEIDNSLITNYNIFELTSENLNNGKWDDIISYTDKGENKSPQLSWEPIEGASSYVVYMVDTSMQYWIHWKSEDVTETNLSLGYAGETEYIGPYPPEGGTHTYEIYVIALKNSAERVKGGLNGQNPKFTSFVESLDTDADGNAGNIVGAAHISGTFTN